MCERWRNTGMTSSESTGMHGRFSLSKCNDVSPEITIRHLSLHTTQHQVISRNTTQAHTRRYLGGMYLFHVVSTFVLRSVAQIIGAPKPEADGTRHVGEDSSHVRIVEGVQELFSVIVHIVPDRHRFGLECSFEVHPIFYA